MTSVNIKVVGLAAAALCVAGLAGAAAPAVSLADAAQKGDRAGVRALLQRQADPNTPSTDGTTPLHWAVQHDDVETVGLLLKAGAKATTANRYGATPLYVACQNGNADIVERLLKAGADANAALPEGETALMTAARTGNVGTVKLLLGPWRERRRSGAVARPDRLDVGRRRESHRSRPNADRSGCRSQGTFEWRVHATVVCRPRGSDGNRP